MVPAQPQALKDTVWNSDDNHQQRHFERRRACTRVLFWLVKIQSAIIAECVSEVAEGSDEGLPLVSHPDDGKIDSNYGGQEGPADEFEGIEPTSMIKNWKRHEDIAKEGYVDNEDKMFRAERALDC